MNNRKVTWLWVVAGLMMSPDVARAQDLATGNAVVVFDASGSMWGQIDGIAKIDIARTAFAEAGTQLAHADGPVGLIAYGHRRKGDCRDIEVIVDPQQGTFAAVNDAVAGLTPKGKTPLSDALRSAANLIRHNEDRATVVLFSDGVETCNADPCAVAAQLEQEGLDFTAHVIGFDIATDADRAQLACIADATGGLYRDAGSARDVADALAEIGTTLTDAPSVIEDTSASVAIGIVLDLADGTFRPNQVRLKATQKDTGAVTLLGTLTGAEEIITGLSTNLPAGGWQIEVMSDEGGGVVDITVAEPGIVSVPFAASQGLFSLIDNSPYALGAAHYFFLKAENQLQGNAEYTVGLAPVGGGRSDLLDFEYRFGSDSIGFTAHDFESPALPGAYEVVVMQGNEVLQRFPVTYTADARPAWRGATRGDPGGMLDLNITGNLYYNNKITLQIDGVVVAETNVDSALSPSGWAIALPDTPGLYDLAYRYDGMDGRVTDVLAQIMVGDLVLPDDPDTVAPPDTAASTNGGGGFECEQPVCLYSGTSISLPDVPIHKGFGVANEVLNNNGQASFDVVNTATGDVITLNPGFMSNLVECFGITADGRRAGDTDVPVDQLCLTQGSAAETIAQFESLETWRARENQTSFEAGLSQDRVAHAAAMGEQDDFSATSLNTTWTISTLDAYVPVGVISFDRSDKEPTEMQALLTVYATPETGLDADRTVPLTATVLSANAPDVLGMMATESSDLGVSLQLSRPPDWDKQDNVFHGLMVISGTGTTLRVEMF